MIMDDRVNRVVELLSGGDITAATRFATRAAAKARRTLTEDQQGLAAFLNELGTLFLYHSNSPFVGQPFLEEALALRRCLPSEADLKQSLHIVGVMRQAEGRFDEAAALYTEELQLPYDKVPEGWVDRLLFLVSLSNVVKRSGDSKKAHYLLEQQNKSSGLSDAECQRACNFLLDTARATLAGEDFGAAREAAVCYLRLSDVYPSWTSNICEAATIVSLACSRLRDYTPAESFARRAYRAAPQAEQERVALLLRDILVQAAQELLDTDPAESVTRLEEAVTLLEDDNDSIKILLAMALKAAGKAPEAEACLTQALSTCGDASQTVIEIELAVLELDRHDFVSAERRLRSLVANLKTQRKPILITVLINLAAVRESVDDLQGAATLLREALVELRDRPDDEEDTARAFVLISKRLVNVLLRDQRLSEALDTQTQLAEFTSRAGNPVQDRTVRVNLANILRASGDQTRATVVYKTTLVALREAGDITSQAYVSCLIGVGCSNLVNGHSETAWAQLTVAASIANHLDENESLVVEITSLFVTLPDAPEQRGQDLASMTNLPGEHMGHLVALAKLVISSGRQSAYGVALLQELVSHSRHDPAERRTFVRSLLAFARSLEVKGTEAASHHNSGAAFYEQADSYITEALVAIRAAGGGAALDGRGGRPGAPDRYTEEALVLRGRIASAFGRDEEAFSLHRQAQAFRSRWLSNQSVYQGAAIDDVIAAAVVGRWAEAHDALAAWVRDDDRALMGVLHSTDERLLIGYLKAFQPLIEVAVSVALTPNAPQSILRIGLDLVLRRKAIVADAMRERTRPHSPNDSGPASQLLQASAGVVDAALPARSVLVEFVRSHPIALHRNMAGGEPLVKPPRYSAFLLEKGGSVTAIDIGLAEKVDLTVADWLRHMGGNPDNGTETGENKYKKSSQPCLPSLYSSLGFALDDALSPKTQLGFYSSTYSGDLVRAALLDPITSRVQADRLIIAPDGIVNFVPFQALPTKSQGWVVADGPRIDYVTTGRDLLRNRGPVHICSSPAVIAAPNFDLGTFVANGPFQPLEGTKAEGEDIARVLGVGLVSGDTARKKSLLTYDSPCVLHIATHAFVDESAHDERDPLASLRGCGLALAGANGSGSEGILTAEEATQLRLVGTDLVVLSACETGRGLWQSGEGVMGLRRAFLIAGARVLVVSQWAVPDNETCSLMIEFYTNLKTGNTVTEALRVAQESARRRNPHPFYWGAFISIGELDLVPRLSRAS
jgi:CHAT domain-containing protein/tetratricopeptide (TPR) repeat protein